MKKRAAMGVREEDSSDGARHPIVVMMSGARGGSDGVETRNNKQAALVCNNEDVCGSQRRGVCG